MKKITEWDKKTPMAQLAEALNALIDAVETLEKKMFMLEQKVESYYLGKEAADEWVKRHNLEGNDTREQLKNKY